MSFSAKRSAYSDMPSFSSQSPISCTVAHPLRHLSGEHIRLVGSRPFLLRYGLEWPALGLARPSVGLSSAASLTSGRRSGLA